MPEKGNITLGKLDLDAQTGRHHTTLLLGVLFKHEMLFKRMPREVSTLRR